ncbi:MAG: MerR family transcriptional regulator [Desulfovibrio sp.]|nr:MerR family transcriptional regulator [Desulfovibrio sp.]
MKESYPTHTLSISELAQHFEISETTCRYYCRRFCDYIMSSGEGLKRRYHPSTIEVLACVVEEMKKSHLSSKVEEVLQARFKQALPENEAKDNASQENTAQEIATKARHLPATTHLPEQINSLENLDNQALPPLALAFMERQTMALEGIAKLLNLLTTHLCAGSMLSGFAGKNSLSDLQKEVKRLAILLDANEKNQQADFDQLRKWMTTILKLKAKSA